MASGDQYGPALPPGMAAGNEPASQQSPEERSLRKQAVIGPCLPPGMQKPADSGDGQASMKIKSDMEYNIQDEEDDDNGDGGKSQDPRTIGPLPSERKQDGEDAGLTAEEFERRSKRMKDNLTIKAEAEEGPVKREEWMTELPPEMGKNFGLQSRNFSKGNNLAGESGDRSAWTDTPSGSKEKDSSKGKKRKLEDAKVVSTRDNQLHEQVESYNKSKRSESLLDMHTKKLKKKGPAVVTSTPADSTQAAAAAGSSSTATTTVPATQNGRVSAQQPQHNIQQYYQLPEEVRDSLDLLSEQKNAEFYGNEYNGGEFNEAKPLADLLINPNMAGYSQEGGSFQAQAQPVFSTSQVIAQAYGNSQQVQAAPVFSQVVSSTNNFPQVLPAQTPNGMSIAAVSSTPGQDPAAVANGQQQAHVVDVQGHQIQAQAVGQAHIATQQAQSYAEAYAAQVIPDSSVLQQQGGQVVTFSLPGGQNMIIASPHMQQAGQNYVIQQQGAQHGQNIVIAAPAQQALPGNFIIKADPDELGHNIVLTQQNLQQALGQNVLFTQDGHLAHGESIVLTTADGQQRHIQTTRHIQPQPQQQVITQGIPIQAGGAHVPQVSFVMPQVNSLFPQIQQTPAPSATASISPETFLQLCAKMDKMINAVTESQAVLAEMSKKLERIENHLFPQPVTIPTAATIKINKSKPKPIAPGSSTPTTTPVAGAVTKASLKASLSSYLTISDYNASDKLKRSDSNSDLFIPVGTVSMVQGQMMVEAPSPSNTPETASSTVQELPSEQGLIPVVMGSDVSASARSSDINVPIVDSQSGIAVTVYDEGSDGQKFQLGPGSGKDPTARFSCTNMNPKIVILDPRFWDILVEDFQKNMNTDQIIVAMSSTRKPLVRNIGNSEISICSTILKEAESACQGRRERLAKELVFRIFTLGEVYDRNVSGVFYINGKKMENKNKALDPAKIAAIHYLVMKYPPSVVDNPRLERLVWKNCVDRINDALRRIYNWIHKIVDVTNIMSKLPTGTIMMH